VVYVYLDRLSLWMRRWRGARAGRRVPAAGPEGAGFAR